jgi:hypothetical protein
MNWKTYLPRAALGVVLLSVALYSLSYRSPTGTGFLLPDHDIGTWEAMPPAQQPVWRILVNTGISLNPNTGFFHARFPRDVRALDGTDITIDGYMLPQQFHDPHSTFILSYFSPDCPFCPPGEANTMLRVAMREPINLTDGIITLQGRFVITGEQSDFLFFKLEDAALLPSSQK